MLDILGRRDANARWLIFVAAALGGFRFFCELIVLRFWSGSLARPIGPSHSSTRQSLALAPNPRPVTFVVVAVAVALPCP